MHTFNYLNQEDMVMEEIKKYAYEDDAPSLCEAYKDYFRVGAAINTRFFKEGFEKELALIRRQYNTYVLDLESKPVFIHPEEDRYVFEHVDKFVEFGEQQGAILRGHTLVWHQSCPDWFFLDKDGNEVTKEVLLERMRAHIKTIVSHYRGRIHSWDVVNEVIYKDGGKMRETKWYKIAGTDFIKEAYRAAHEADPDARLIINDYNLEEIEDKADTMIEFVREMHAEGVPIHGIGLQMHLYLLDTDIEVMKKNVRKLLVLRDIIPDLKLEVTELDMSCYHWDDTIEDVDWTDELRELFISKYKEVFAFYKELAEEGVLDSVIFWGTHDGNSWLNGFPRKHKNYPLLFDRELAIKPACLEVIKLAEKK